MNTKEENNKHNKPTQRASYQTPQLLYLETVTIGTQGGTPYIAEETDGGTFGS